MLRSHPRRAFTLIELLAALAVLVVVVALTTAVTQKVRAINTPPAPTADPSAAPVALPEFAAGQPNPPLAPPGGRSCSQATPSAILPTVTYSSPQPSLYWSIPVTGGTTYRAIVTNPNAITGVGTLGELYDVPPTDPAAMRPGHDLGRLFASAAGSPPGTYTFTPARDGWMCLRVTGVDVVIVSP